MSLFFFFFSPNNNTGVDKKKEVNNMAVYEVGPLRQCCGPVKLRELIPVKLQFLTFLSAALDPSYVKASKGDGDR